MTFDQFICRLPELRRATAKDNERILNFLRQNAGPQERLTLFYDRSPDFFALLCLSSPEHFVLLFENSDGEIEGVISYSLLRAKDFDTLYVGDLKIKAKSEATKAKWRAFAQEFIENLREMEEFKAVRFIHMVMMDDNTKAYQRLIKSNLLSFRYKKTRAYKMVNILAQKPFHRTFEIAWSCEIRPATESALELTVAAAVEGKFSCNHAALTKYRANKMAALSHLLEVKDHTGQVVFRCSLEDVAPAKRIQLRRLPLRLKLLSLMLSFLKGKRYVEGESLNILYVSNLSYSTQERKAVLIFALKKALAFAKGRYHMLSLSLFQEDEELILALAGPFLTQIEPLGFYEIIPGNGAEIPPDASLNLNMSYI